MAMPQNTNNDDYIIVGGESDSAELSPDNHSVDETTPAQTNDDSTPEITPSADIESLEAERKAKARNERQLGSVAKKLANSLIKKAVDGDEEAAELIKDDPEVEKYVKKKFPNYYENIFNDSQYEEKEEDLEEKIYKRIKERESSEKLHGKILSLGIKGQENFEKAMQIAQSLIDKVGIDEAVNIARMSINGNSKTQPSMPRSVANNTNDSIIVSKEKLQESGIDLKTFEKYKNELPKSILKNFSK